MKAADIIALVVMVGAVGPFMLVLMTALRRIRDLREEVLVLKIQVKQAQEDRERLREGLRQEGADRRRQEGEVIHLLQGILELREDYMPQEGHMHMEPVEDEDGTEPAGVLDLHQQVPIEIFRDVTTRSTAMAENFRQVYGGSFRQFDAALRGLSQAIGRLDPSNPEVRVATEEVEKKADSQPPTRYERMLDSED
jgi:hypothetical protein